MVLLLFQVDCTRQFIQVFFTMFCKSKIAVLIAINWKVICEIIENTIGESPLDKLYNYKRFFFFFSGKKSIYQIRGYCILCMQLNLVL